MNVLNSMYKHAFVLSIFAAVCALIVATTYQYTREKIQQNEADAKIRLLQEVLPKNQYDNNVAKDTKILPADKLLGTSDSSIAHIAKKHGAPIAIALTAIAPDGYSGKIKLLIGIHSDGHIVGVRAISHKETPGLGDKIEIKKSDWITQFEHSTFSKPASWQVHKDGGDFDQITGATITARAVITAVYRALEYFEENREILFAD